ncbi:MAG: FkbM family methyltransferase [Betaproteobacteria bacterium]|nr:FkbM family methyltransferase [Betaproteobacteria bacterium]
MNPFKKLFSDLRVFRRAFLIKSWTVIHSQYGEDAVLQHLMTQPRGVYVDVGCWHPKKFSNTWFLYRRGWRGVNIDLGEIKIRTFQWVRPEDYNVVAAVSDRPGSVTVQTDKDFSVGEQIVLEGQGSRPGFGQSRVMETRTLTDILDHSPFAGKTIQLLNIDAEGHDLHVLKGLDFDRYAPETVLVESYVQSLEDLTAAELHGFLSGKGYRLFNWVGPTLFYKRQRLATA